MTKRYLGLILGVMILAAGCSSGNVEAVPSEEATAAAAEETQEDTSGEEPSHTEEEMESSTKEDISLTEEKESLQAVEESLKAKEESLQAAEESLKAVEESVKSEEDSEYSDIVKSPEKYTKKNVKFSGTITRSASVGSTSVQIVLAVDGDAENRVVGEYKRSIVDTNLAVGDEITLSGEFQGLIRYRMQTGGAESLPTVNIEKIEDIVKAEPETEAVPFSMPETIEEAAGSPSAAPGLAAGIQDPGAGENISEETPSEGGSPVISAGQ